jgi:hypothetical protein
MKTATGICNKVQLGATLGLLALTAAGAANAGCMMGAPHQSSGSKQPAATFVPSVYRPGITAGSFVKTDYFGQYDEGIVGLWQFQLSGYPAPDWGTQAWHGDGTELMFSGGQDPETGDVCQGVWRQIGKDTFTLNHIAMGWNQPGGSFVLRVHLHEIIKLNPAGTEFTGTYTLTGYCESGAIPPFPIPAGVTCATPNPFFEFNPKEPVSASNPNNVALPTGTGTVTATRVVPD